MAAHTTIHGNITDIAKRETQTGKEYLGIDFDTTQEHENDNGFHEIRMWFTSNSMTYDLDKVMRILEIAGLPAIVDINTIDDAIETLAQPEIVYLEIPINVSPNENPISGKVYAQYDVGFLQKDKQDKSSAFSGFQDILKQRMAAVAEQGDTGAGNNDVVLCDDEPIF
jgi:C1A family cysteine protease